MSLVSIIIPCYNAEQWIGEAIDSVLSQTYSPIELIIIDDGSTDNSLKIIKSYGNKVKWEKTLNRGQSAAKNKGFNLSQGKYIQWLDADDYILPEKIEKQVAYLEESDSDIVYGDWRHQCHKKNGSIVLEEVKISGEHQNILEALLSGWWAAPLAYLMKREIVEYIGRWDEDLRIQDDPDFWIRAAIAGFKFSYQSGCYSIYRRYGKITVSTKDSLGWCREREIIWEKATQLLIKKNSLDCQVKKALSQGYFNLARTCFDLDKNLYIKSMKIVKEMNPNFVPKEHFIYNLLARSLGFKVADCVASLKRKIIKKTLYLL
jgi:glycosyltransferase involved in cell wall biosynthesis